MNWLFFIFIFSSIPGMNLCFPAGGIFTAVSSGILKPHAPYQVLVTAAPSTEPFLPMKFVLENHDKTYKFFTPEIILNPSESRLIPIPINVEKTVLDRASGGSPWTLVAVTSQGSIALSNSMEIKYDQRTQVDERKLSKLFLQTDKPLYKPEDLVQIRVILLDQLSRPLTLPSISAVNVTITDSKKNIMQKWINQRPIEGGLVSLKFPLASEPNFGLWAVEVKSGVITDRMEFHVRPFVLQKFSVALKINPYITIARANQVSIQINSDYTYARGVDGLCTLQAEFLGTGGRNYVKTLAMEEGKASTILDLTPLNGLMVTTQYKMTANVSERYTNRWYISSQIVAIHAQDVYSIHWLNKPSKFRPGIPLLVQLQVMDGNKKPVVDNSLNPISLTIGNNPGISTSINGNGLASFEINPEKDVTNFVVQYRNYRETFTLPTAYTSKSGTFLQIENQNGVLDRYVKGRDYNFTVKSNKEIDRPLQWILWNGKMILNLSVLQPIKEQMSQSFRVNLPQASYNEARLLIYFVEPIQNEIIAASLTIPTPNNLDMTYSVPPPPPPTVVPIPKKDEAPLKNMTTTARPRGPAVWTDLSTTQRPNPLAFEVRPSVLKSGQNITFSFKTDPRSIVAIRGIDQSLLIMSDRTNDFNIPKLGVHGMVISHRTPMAYWNSDSLKEFCQSGLVILSNGELGREQEERRRLKVRDRIPGEKIDLALLAPVRGRAGEAIEENPEVERPAVIPVRKNFPDTWLWTHFQVDNTTGEFTLPHVVPDTITSWIVTGVSLNPETGLAVGTGSTVTVSQSFFVTINLPYSLTKRDTFTVEVFVHNYLPNDVIAIVTMENRHKGQFIFVDSRDLDLQDARRDVLVKANSVAATGFTITLTSFGLIPINVKATTGTAGDAVSRELRVVPVGVKKYNHQVIFLEPKLNEGGVRSILSQNLTTTWPKERVRGTEMILVNIIGDQMSAMFKNLNHLLKIPTGCGEQTMLGLVPNFLALDYMTILNNIDPVKEKEAVQNLQTGYANQMKYKKSDGSFSVWTTTQGTTWLTAYVIKCFVQAKKYITIDPAILYDGVQFLVKNQKSNGEWGETGAFYHPEMRGRTGESGVGLTAFITLSLIEVSKSRFEGIPNVTNAINQGLRFVSGKSVLDLNDPYIINMVTYALVEWGHTQQNKFFTKMQSLSNLTADEIFKFWKGKNGANPALNVEMTSYALLAHLSKAKSASSESLSIAKWLLSQRNELGGFSSTQDTVVGLTALTKFAQLTGTQNLNTNLDLQIKTNRQGESPSFNVNGGNRLVLQQFEIKYPSQWIALEAQGNGSVIAHVTQTWVVDPKENQMITGPLTQKEFVLTARMEIPDKAAQDRTLLHFCVKQKYSLKETYVNALINLPSGYEFDEDAMDTPDEVITPQVKRREVREKNSVMEVYFENMKNDAQNCLKLVVIRQHMVASKANPIIRVYDYHNPKIEATVRYNPAHRVNACDICKIKNNCDLEGCEVVKP